MLISMLDKEQDAGTKRVASALDAGLTRPADHEKPLICAAVPVLGAALGSSRLNDHLSGLSAPVGQRHSKSLAEP
jgi:hypothetical protein